MDVSATCNLACRDCYTKQTHVAELMNVERFRTLMTRIATAPGLIGRLHLNWRGEPLTNKKLPEILKIRHDLLPNVPMELHTNGILLNDRNSGELVASGLPSDIIYVSLDGGGREAHESNRGEGSWAPALRGLRRLLDARDQLGPGPQIGIYEIYYGPQTLYDRELIELSRRCDDWTQVRPVDVQGREATYADGPAPFGPCMWAGNAMCVTAKGDAHVCPLSFRSDGRLGNVFEDDPQIIAERAREFRQNLAQFGRGGVAHCRGCQKVEGDMNDA
ncbi:MAG: radical SAM/SPASM domain-containing protein [Vitreimonas sp.]